MVGCMSQSKPLLSKTLLENALNWFQPEFCQNVVFPIESNFPNFPLHADIRDILRRTEDILAAIKAWPGEPIPTGEVIDLLSRADPKYLPFFKQTILRYRRFRAAETERLTEKTFHLGLVGALEQDVKVLDALVTEEQFQRIDSLRLPRLKDFLPIQYIESSTVNQIQLLPRQHDEKFHILQAPSLFLSDLAYFRARCEDREMPLAIAFLDIDHFREFNKNHTETKVDRNLLPRFMQAVEAHVFHHGYAYRQGGDEYLILTPALSRTLSIDFFDELRCKLANLEYPDINGKTTVSIGLCIVESECPLTDRELRDRASQAKKVAKDSGRNCIAAYEGSGFSDQELRVVRPRTSTSFEGPDG